MRNLKKVLALVLALVMSMSLATIANASIDFSDAEDVKYDEAVDVMSSIGVIEGFETGAFNPNGTLTREQAAKIIAYMLLGPDSAEKLGPQNTGFSDVPATRWSSPYIGYCVSLGIVNGNGDGTFNPTGELTGYAFSKMLLTALGYGVNDEYVGAGWTLAVARDGAQIGLFDEVKVSNAAITRDEACQLSFDALRSNLVVWSDLFNTYTAYSGVLGNQQLLGTLATNVFKLAPTYKADGYGYNTRAWRQDNKVVTDYYFYAEIIDTVTDTDTTYGSLLKDYTWQTKDSDGNTVTIPTYINGTLEIADTLATLKAAPASNKMLMNGYVATLVDEDENGEVDKVVVTVEYLAKVTKVNAETASAKRSVNLEIYDTTGKITKTQVETEEFEKDQYILVIPEANTTAGFQNPLSMKAAEVVTGSVSAYYKETVGNSKIDGSVTVDGVKYNYNSIFDFSEKALGEDLSTDGYTLGDKATYNFYLDSLGNVIGVAVADDSISDYAYIIEKGEDSFQQHNIAKVLLSNGEIKTYTISSKSDDAALDKTTAGSDTSSATAGTIWGYSVNADGEIVLTSLTGKYSQTANSQSNTINSFKKGNSVISYKGGSAVAYATDETVFVYYNNNKVAGIYVGKDNAPDISSTQNASVVVKTDNGVAYAQFVVITSAPAALTGDNFVYALSAEYKGFSKDNNGDMAYYFEVIKDGEKVVIATDRTSLVAGTIYNYGVNETAFSGDSANNVEAGLYELTTMPASSFKAGVAVDVVNSGVIVGNSNADQFVLAPETVIADVDLTDSTTSVVFEATVDDDDTITVVYDVVGGLNVAKAIFITDTGANG